MLSGNAGRKSPGLTGSAKFRSLEKRCLAGLIAFTSGFLFNPANAQSGQQSQGHTIKTDDGGLFMEEVPEQRKTPRLKTPGPDQRFDFGSLGVPVDAQGKIIPIIQPTNGGVLPNFSRTEIEYTAPTVYVPYYSFAGPYGYAPYYSPFGNYPVPVYRPQYQGALAVPLGIPRYFSSDSADPASQQAAFNFSGKYYNYGAPSSIWSPAWNSPWGRGYLTPSITQFQQQGSIRSFFPQNLNQP